MAGPVFELNDIAFAYRRQPPVLRNLSLSVAESEVLGIAGPNGTGKSTLFGVMAGLLAPDSGEARLNGVLLSGMRRRDIARQVALVPQTEHAAFPFTVEQTVLMGRTPHLASPLAAESREDRRIAREVIEAVGLGPLAARPVQQLSGGDRQLVLLARALAQDAPALLLDEPTASLDLAHQQAVARLVRGLAAERNRTVVLIAHDLNLAAMVCDRIAILHEGRIAESGPPADVLKEELIRSVWGAGVRVHAAGRRTLIAIDL